MPLFINFPEWLSPFVIPGVPFIRWYGLMYLVAFAIAYGLTVLQLRDQELSIGRSVDKDTVVNLFFWTIIGLVIGSRIFATTIYDTTGRYLRQPWLIFWPFDGEGNFSGLQGMSYHGGLTGAVVAFIIYCKAKKIDVLEMGDVVITSVPLGYTFGRIGNFINGELYGRITSAFYGVLFPHAEAVPTSHPAVQRVAEEVGIDITGQSFVNLPRHPSQLYEAFLEGVLLWAIMWWVRKHKPFRGFMIGIYLVGYALARYVAEYFRAPDPGLDFVIQWGPVDNPRWLLLSPLNITTGQVLSLIMAAGGALVLFILWTYAKRTPRVETFEAAEKVAPQRRRSKRRA